MTLKEEFDNIEIMFESQIGTLKYDELYEASNHCVRIADEFAIEFANWALNNRAQIWRIPPITDEQVLEIFKKEKGL
jgi:hypothetical protein